MIFGGITVGGVGVGQLHGLIGDARKLPILHEIQITAAGLGAIFGTLFGFQYSSRIGAVKRRRFSHFGFWKTRAVAGVEGESLAKLIGQAGALAGL